MTLSVRGPSGVGIAVGVSGVPGVQAAHNEAVNAQSSVKKSVFNMGRDILCMSILLDRFCF
jgi:hypothetical protein